MPTNDHNGSICAFAWARIDVDPKGAVRPCCEFNDVLKDSNGTEFNIATHSLNEITHSESMQQIRATMLSGQKPEPCNKCWQDQAAGRFSLRQVANMNIDIDSTLLSTDPVPLQYVGLALGNICNLRCRICGPWASSVWASDEIRRKGKENSQWELNMLKQGSWPLTAVNFWKDFENCLSNVKTISFYGGEPFMSPQHIETLKKLVHSGKSKNITLQYSTNGTVFPEELIDIHDHFKEIRVNFSLDDIGQRFEYQRKNAIWSDVVNVVSRFNQVALSNKKLRCSITCTVSVFNALYLTEIVTHFSELWPNIDCVFNVLRVVERHSILYAPMEYKNAVVERLSKDHFTLNVQQKLNTVVKLIQDSSSNDQFWNELKDETLQLDQFRFETMQHSHPELAGYLFGADELFKVDKV